MTRTLLIIAGAALVLCLATLGGAAAIGGQDLARHGWAWTFHDRNGDGDSIRFERDNGPEEPDVTKTLAWTGGSELIADLSADVTYVQGDQAGVVVTGPRAIVDRVRLEGSDLTTADSRSFSKEHGAVTTRVRVKWNHDGINAWSDSDRLKIVVTAPSVNRFEMNGSGKLTLRDYDQDTLSVNLSGSGEVTGTGRTRALTLDINGSGEAELADLATTDAKVDISGSGEARIAPTGRAEISISGSGDVDLATRPASLTQSVSGSGTVTQN